MQVNMKTGACASLAALTVAGSAFANSNVESRLAELEARDAANQQLVANLRSEIESMRNQNGEAWIDANRQNEIRDIVQDVLADADTRSSLLQNGAAAGWNNGFFLQSGDGNFRLNLKGQFQIRWVGSFQDEDSSGDSSRWGFENYRTRFSFGGHVVDPSWKYFLWTGYNASGGNALLDAWVQKSFDNGWSLKVGQFKGGPWKEWLISETRLQFVERSTLTGRFGGAYTQGASLDYAGDQFRMSFQYTDGLRNSNTPYSTAPGSGMYQASTEMALTARGEYLVSGDWSATAHNTSFRGSDAATIIGGGVHYQMGENGTTDDENEVFQVSGDLNMKWGGASLFAGFIWSSIDNDSGTMDRDEWGILVQGGYFLNDDWELIGRVEYGDLDGGGAVTDDLFIASVGFNRFYNGHGLKWTTDIGYSFEEVDSGWATQGWRADGADQDGQILIRSQLQLLF